MSDPVCELPKKNASTEEIRRLLSEAKTIAVVGLSDDPARDSHRIAAYLQDRGYRVIPVNPRVGEVLGEKAYPDLASVPVPIDIVDVFRRVEAIPAIVDEAIAAGAKAVWMQLGLAHNASAEKARAAGLDVVMNKCIMVEHRRLGP
ncbi:MAG TPA: CoA-binding protein [Thermoanaerobaculia bacterium]|jgi:predicted CoA-binding protein|nr:CoA-binding protein [Thermoanaerobaculia bacterium]